MKITSKQYALSLYETVRNKKDSEVRGAIKKFVEVVIYNNDISKVDRIISQFSKIWNREQGIVEVEFISSLELDKKIVKLLNNYMVELSGAENVVVSEKIDKGILGGVVIKYGDKVLDGSLKMNLREFSKFLVL